MKRFCFTFIACLLLAATVITPVWGTENDDAPALTGIDQNLIVHYDFEGDTLEVQMADKAPAGVSKENLSFYTTQDEEGNDLSYVADGVAHIDHAIVNYMAVRYTKPEEGAEITGTETGTDIWNLTTNNELTVFTAISASGSPNQWADFVDFQWVARMLLEGSKNNTADFSNFLVRGGLTAFSSNAVQWLPKNREMSHDTDVLYIAVTYEYNPTTKTLTGTTYHSFDFGKKWVETPGSFTEVEDFLAANTYISLGKRLNGSYHTKPDKVHGTDFDFYDFRVYNKALTLDEVKTIKTGHEPVEDDNTPPASSEPDNTVTDAPNVPDATVTEAPGATGTEAPSTTTAAPTTNNTQTTGGCGAGIASGAAVAMLSLGAALCAAQGKKKKK